MNHGPTVIKKHTTSHFKAQLSYFIDYAADPAGTGGAGRKDWGDRSLPGFRAPRPDGQGVAYVSAALHGRMRLLLWGQSLLPLLSAESTCGEHGELRLHLESFSLFVFNYRLQHLSVITFFLSQLRATVTYCVFEGERGSSTGGCGHMAGFLWGRVRKGLTGACVGRGSTTPFILCL